jgi:hypothetical protein
MKCVILFLLFLTNSFKPLAQISTTIIDTKTILLDGKLPIFTSKKLLETYLGDSIKKKSYNPECGFYSDEEYINVKFSFYSKNGISYLVYKTKADLDEIDLAKSKERFVQFGNYKINKDTRLIDLKKYFPKSYADYINLNKDEKNQTESFFMLSPCKTCDDRIHIILDKNLKVKAVAYWTPC